MNNEILSTINKILSDEEGTKQIMGLISSLNKSENANQSEPEKENENITVTNKKAIEIQKKIDVLYALMPLFDDNNKKKIDKIINALKIIKTMLSLT